MADQPACRSDPASAETARFAERVIRWQRQQGRHDLPWQQTQDVYRVWLSEIMLQQTQVNTVLPYYQRFLAAFPTLADLAAAPLEQVLEYWAGLGYYARARHLHRCAQSVMAQGGAFPATAAELATLPGIGRSTAAAIAAFCRGERAAILDGNVKRVLCRHFALEGFPGERKTERKLWALAESLLPAGPAAGEMTAYTQGLMDLGATCCLRQKPRCTACPVQASCLAYQQGRQAELPTARPGKTLPVRQSYFVLLFRQTTGTGTDTEKRQVLLQRRPLSGIWGGLLVPPEFPAGQEGEAELPDFAPLLARHGVRAVDAPRHFPALPHGFTHFRLTLQPLWIRVAAAPASFGGTAADGIPETVWLDLDADLERAALPTPIRKLLSDGGKALRQGKTIA